MLAVVCSTSLSFASRSRAARSDIPTILGTTPCRGFASTSVTLSNEERVPPAGNCFTTTPIRWPALAGETPIWIDHVVEHPGDQPDRACVLINLQAEPPPFFSRFERLAEIVGIDEEDAVAARARYRFYRERGYELRTHNLAEL